jgi:hypothetical protein
VEEIVMATKLAGRRWLPLVVLVAFALTTLVGCGGVKRIRISGTVTVDGTPIDGGILSFSPDAAKGNTAKISCTSPVREGRYELETIGITGSDSGSGVPPGWYKVTYNRIDLATKKRAQADIQVNDKYKNADTTPLSVEVKDNPEPGAYDFKLTK